MTRSSSPALHLELRRDLLRQPAIGELRPGSPALLGRQKAAHAVVGLVLDLLELRVLLECLGGLVVAAGEEAAALGRRDHARRTAGDRHERLVARTVQARDGAKQAPRVWMLRRAEDALRARGLDDLARVHDVDLV